MRENQPIKFVSIVLVEDDPGHSRLIMKNLRRAGINNDISMFEDGQAALEMLQKHPLEKEPLLILLDLNLPVLDGYQVLERIKANEKLRRIPVIVLTTTDDPREIDRCYELGCNAYVSKPVHYEDFIDVILKLGLFLSVIQFPDRESGLE